MKIPHNFGFTEEHDLLRQSARRFLTERATAESVRKTIEDKIGWDRALYKEMAELGWVGLAVSDEAGGAGLGWLHLALLLEEHGRALLPSPLLPSTLAAIALARAGAEDAVCAAVCAGRSPGRSSVPCPTRSELESGIDGRGASEPRSPCGGLERRQARHRS